MQLDLPKQILSKLLITTNVIRHGAEQIIVHLHVTCNSSVHDFAVAAMITHNSKMLLQLSGCASLEVVYCVRHEVLLRNPNNASTHFHSISVSCNVTKTFKSMTLARLLWQICSCSHYSYSSFPPYSCMAMNPIRHIAHINVYFEREIFIVHFVPSTKSVQFKSD